MTSKKKNRKTIVRWNLIELGCRMLGLVSLVCIHVMRGLVPRIHLFPAADKAWMAGTSPAMTAHKASAPEMISISSLVIIA